MLKKLIEMIRWYLEFQDENEVTLVMISENKLKFAAVHEASKRFFHPLHIEKIEGMNEEILVVRGKHERYLKFMRYIQARGLNIRSGTEHGCVSRIVSWEDKVL